MTQLAHLKSKLLDGTFTIDDLQHFVDATENANDWSLIKSVIELVYFYDKENSRIEAVTILIESRNVVIVAKEIPLESFREREEIHKSRQRSRTDNIVKAIQHKANDIDA